jgi:hypothetical protein
MMQLSRAIAIHPGLTTLLIAYNGLGNGGIKELLQAGKRNKQLTHLDVSNNYVFPSQREMEELKREQQQTQIQKLDVTGNYIRVASEQWLQPQTFFYSRPLQSHKETFASFILKDEKSDAIPKNISCDHWWVYLFRDTASGQDPEHAMLLIEGMTAYGQRFLEVSDFRPGCRELAGIRGDVKVLQAWDPDRISNSTTSWHYKAYAIARVTGNKLRNNILADADKTLFYGSKGVGSKGRIYNCYTWALAKLRETGIISPNEEPMFVAITSFYLRGRQVTQVPNNQEAVPQSWLCCIS